MSAPADLLAELSALRAEMRGMRAEMQAMASAADEARMPTRRPEPIEDAIRDYSTYLDSKGIGAKHARDVMGTLARFTAQQQVARTDDVTAQAGAAFLVAERNRRVELRPGQKHIPLEERPTLSLRSVNRLREHLRAFSRWLHLEGRTPEDAFQRLPKQRAQTDRRHERRALSEPELRRLLAPGTPLLRRAIYLTAATTGLRRSELRALLKVHVDWRAGEVRLPAKLAKNRKASTVFLPQTTRDLLWELHDDPERALLEARAWGRSGPDRGAYLFPAFMSNTRTLYADLERVGIQRQTREGVVDFHSFRVFFATALARLGTPQALTQGLMRHSSADLTVGYYTRLHDDDRRAAVDALGAAIAKRPREGGAA